MRATTAIWINNRPPSSESGTKGHDMKRLEVRQTFGALGLAVLVIALSLRPHAQTSNKEAPVVVGHFHLNVTSVEAHKKFWVDTLGGKAEKLGSSNTDVIRFPDTLIVLRVQPPTGPTRGTALDHIGFAVPDVPALTTRWSRTAIS